MLVSGAFAMVLSEKLGWGRTYLLMGFIMLSCVILTLLGSEPEEGISPPKNLKEAVLFPLKDFFLRNGAWVILLFIFLYKIGDAYASSLLTAFLIRGVGFSPAEVGTINKAFGLFSLIIGAMLGGAIITRIGLFKSLLIFGILQAVSNLSFSILSVLGKNYEFFIFTVAFENISGGMVTSALIAFLMGLCNKNYSAAQYALLSSIASVGRVLISPTAGFLVELLGWQHFFFITFLIAIPGILVLIFVKRNLS